MFFVILTVINIYYMSKKKKSDHRGNKYAHLNEPQATFDYHDKGILTEDEIRDLADEFIAECKGKGLMKVLIITGKGLHSENGPVIGPLLKWYLHKNPAVLSVETARRDRGGEGALEVKLR